MLADYEDRDAWLDKVIVNIKAGFFLIHRTIAQYNEDIHLNPLVQYIEAIYLERGAPLTYILI